MKNGQKTKVVPNKSISLKDEARKQLRIAAENSLQGTKKPAKDFSSKVIERLIDSLIAWVDNKLSA